MMAGTCVALFALAALAAVASIVSTWQTYGADVTALRVLRRTGIRDLQLSWRILEPTPAQASQPFGSKPLRTQAAATPGLRWDPAFPPSLAA
jgi:hypothetical protein